MAAGPDMGIHDGDDYNNFMDGEYGADTMIIDEEPVYRSIAPDMMSCEQALEETPVYGSLEVEPVRSPVSNTICTKAYMSKLSPEEATLKVTELLKGKSAEVEVEDGYIYATMEGPSGDFVKARFAVDVDEAGS